MSDTIEQGEDIEIIDGPREYKIPAWKRDAFQNKLDIANRRMARGGFEGMAFTAAYESFSAKKVVGGVELPDGTTFGGTEVTEPWFSVTVTGGRVTLGNYSFIAALVAEEAGYTVHCAPGENLDGWPRPAVDDIHCDHCGIDRNRKRLYIIRDLETGKLLQLGHSCIELYTGLSPKGLWALTYDEELKSVSEERDGDFRSSDYGIPVNKVLAYAFAFSQGGKHYVSTKAAEFGPEPATGRLVRAWIIEPPKPPQRHRFGANGQRWYQEALDRWHAELEMAKQGDEYAKDESLIADIRAAAETLKAGTDYADNLAVILAGEHVSGRNVGILASLVSVYAREKELAVKRATAPKPAKGFIGQPKQRIKSETTMRLTTVREWAGDFGTTTFMVGYTEDMHCLVWKASGTFNVKPGDTLVLSAFTVKEHSTFGERNPIDQTVIQRAVIKEVKEQD